MAEVKVSNSVNEGFCEYPQERQVIEELEAWEATTLGIARKGTIRNRG